MNPDTGSEVVGHPENLAASSSREGVVRSAGSSPRRSPGDPPVSLGVTQPMRHSEPGIRAREGDKAGAVDATPSVFCRAGERVRLASLEVE